MSGALHLEVVMTVNCLAQYPYCLQVTSPNKKSEL